MLVSVALQGGPRLEQLSIHSRSKPEMCCFCGHHRAITGRIGRDLSLAICASKHCLRQFSQIRLLEARRRRWSWERWEGAAGAVIWQACPTLEGTSVPSTQ